MKVEELFKDGVKPEVGVGVTILMHSDCHAGTIVAVSKSGKSFQFQEDNAELVSGSCQDGSAVYTYSPNTDRAFRTARLVKGGVFKDHGTRIAVGYRREYRDPSF